MFWNRISSDFFVIVRWHIACGTLAALVATAGCGGGEGPARYDVSGSVTYDGQPIPVGSITFLPDKAKGNNGAPGFAKIKEGKYDTRREGKGPIGGPHVIEISGSDGVKPTDVLQGKSADTPRGKSADVPQGRPLFPAYRTTLDLPKKAATQDFVVPKGGGVPR